MYSLWQAHNSQDSEITEAQTVTKVFEVNDISKTVETPMNIISNGDISGLTINGLKTPDITNIQPLVAAPHIVINGSDNNTRIGPYLQFCDLDGIPRVNIFYEPTLNLISFQALVDDPTPTFVFNGNISALNVQPN